MNLPLYASADLHIPTVIKIVQIRIKILAKIEKQIDKLESAHQKEDDIVEAMKSLLEELQDVKICKDSCDCECH